MMMKAPQVPKAAYKTTGEIPSALLPVLGTMMAPAKKVMKLFIKYPTLKRLDQNNNKEVTRFRE